MYGFGYLVNEEELRSYKSSPMMIRIIPPRAEAIPAILGMPVTGVSGVGVSSCASGQLQSVSSRHSGFRHIPV